MDTRTFKTSRSSASTVIAILVPILLTSLMWASSQTNNDRTLEGPPLTNRMKPTVLTATSDVGRTKAASSVNAGTTKLVSLIAPDNASSSHRKKKRAFNAVFVAYGDANFEESKQRIQQEALDTGWFNKGVGLFGPEMLTPAFREKYAEILSLPRGGGYWIWKLDIISQAMEEIDEGDFVVYADAGCTVNKGGEEAFFRFLRDLDESPYDIFGYETPRGIERKYTNDHVYEAFGVDVPDKKTKMLAATVMIYQKGDHFRKFFEMIHEALDKDPFIITDKYNEETKKNRPYFEDNRHDQSLFSVGRRLAGFMLETEHIPTVHKNPEDPFWTTRIRE